MNNLRTSFYSCIRTGNFIVAKKVYRLDEALIGLIGPTHTVFCDGSVVKNVDLREEDYHFIFGYNVNAAERIGLGDAKSEAALYLESGDFSPQGMKLYDIQWRETNVMDHMSYGHYAILKDCNGEYIVGMISGSAIIPITSNWTDDYAIGISEFNSHGYNDECAMTIVMVFEDEDKKGNSNFLTDVIPSINLGTFSWEDYKNDPRPIIDWIIQED